MTETAPRFGNLAAGPVPAAGGESFRELLRHSGVRIERIASRSHADAVGEWYDQPHAEFALLAQGSAVLEFADGQRRALSAGEWVILPAHCRHRVAGTSADALWLAVHCGG